MLSRNSSFGNSYQLPTNNGNIPECTSNTMFIKNLRPIQEIPHRYQPIFSEYPSFNFVQSAIFDDLLYTDESVVVSAPTGSGKTAIFELAVIRALIAFENTKYATSFKAVYISPLKALCEERLIDWHRKFNPFGMNCISVTGDSDNIECRELFNHNLIITTPEKWDCLTRKWRENRKLVELVKLFMIDEVHLLNEDNRGSTLETIVCRMKTIQDSLVAEPNDPPEMVSNKIRFIAVSATIPNIEDIAEWLGKLPDVKYFKFSEDTRPVKLKKIVLDYPHSPKQSFFKFDMSLNYKLIHLIQQYSDGRPTLVFCSTRKIVEMTATHILQHFTITQSPDQRQKLIESSQGLSDSKARQFLMHGVGYHHAGMMVDTRQAIENLFRDGNLPILVTTSTLALGVNLPAHLVIIKGTKCYTNNGFQDYTETAILQMMGRAGRPQFDSTATVLILTSRKDKEKFERMVGGEAPIESNLHRHLTEHLNAEVVLHTITDLNVALQWLSSTFLYIRARKNPRHYGLSVGMSAEQIDKKLMEMCQIDINKLVKAKMLTINQDVVLTPTLTGILMAKYYLAFETVKLFTQLTGEEILLQILTLISKCQEFSDMYLRVNDKKCLNLLNNCKNRQTIRFPLNGKIKTIDMKINCLIQATLGNLDICDHALQSETFKIMRNGDRIVKCLIEYLEFRPRCYKALLSAITLGKCFHAKLWENSPYVSKQLTGIGAVMSAQLVTAGKTSFEKILETDPRQIELLINKKPPMGNNIMDQVLHLPKYTMQLEKISDTTVQVTIILENSQILQEKSTVNVMSVMYLLVGDMINNDILLYEKYRHSSLIRQPQIIKRLEIRGENFDGIEANFISEDWVGIDCVAKFKSLDEPIDPQEMSSRSKKPVKEKSNKQKKSSVHYMQTFISEYMKQRKKTENSSKNELKLPETESSQGEIVESPEIIEIVPKSLEIDENSSLEVNKSASQSQTITEEQNIVESELEIEKAKNELADMGDLEFNSDISFEEDSEEILSQGSGPNDLDDIPEPEEPMGSPEIAKYSEDKLKTPPREEPKNKDIQTKVTQFFNIYSPNKSEIEDNRILSTPVKKDTNNIELLPSTSKYGLCFTNHNTKNLTPQRTRNLLNTSVNEPRPDIQKFKYTPHKKLCADSDPPLTGSAFLHQSQTLLRGEQKTKQLCDGDSNEPSFLSSGGLIDKNNTTRISWRSPLVYSPPTRYSPKLPKLNLGCESIVENNPSAAVGSQQYRLTSSQGTAVSESTPSPTVTKIVKYPNQRYSRKTVMFPLSDKDNNTKADGSLSRNSGSSLTQMSSLEELRSGFESLKDFVEPSDLEKMGVLQQQQQELMAQTPAVIADSNLNQLHKMPSATEYYSHLMSQPEPLKSRENIEPSDLNKRKRSHAVHLSARILSVENKENVRPTATPTTTPTTPGPSSSQNFKKRPRSPLETNENPQNDISTDNRPNYYRPNYISSSHPQPNLNTRNNNNRNNNVIDDVIDDVYGRDRLPRPHNQSSFSNTNSGPNNRNNAKNSTSNSGNRAVELKRLGRLIDVAQQGLARIEDRAGPGRVASPPPRYPTSDVSKSDSALLSSDDLRHNDMPMRHQGESKREMTSAARNLYGSRNNNYDENVNYVDCGYYDTDVEDELFFQESDVDGDSCEANVDFDLEQDYHSDQEIELLPHERLYLSVASPPRPMNYPPPTGLLGANYEPNLGVRRGPSTAPHRSDFSRSSNDFLHRKQDNYYGCDCHDCDGGGRGERKSPEFNLSASQIRNQSPFQMSAVRTVAADDYRGVGPYNNHQHHQQKRWTSNKREPSDEMPVGYDYIMDIMNSAQDEDVEMNGPEGLFASQRDYIRQTYYMQNVKPPHVQETEVRPRKTRSSQCFANNSDRSHLQLPHRGPLHNVNENNTIPQYFSNVNPQLDRSFLNRSGQHDEAAAAAALPRPSPSPSPLPTRMSPDPFEMDTSASMIDCKENIPPPNVIQSKYYDGRGHNSNDNDPTNEHNYAFRPASSSVGRAKMSSHSFPNYNNNINNAGNNSFAMPDLYSSSASLMYPRRRGITDGPSLDEETMSVRNDNRDAAKMKKYLMHKFLKAVEK